MGMHAVFRDWMYARKARRQWQIQEYLIWRGGGPNFGSEGTVELFCDQLRKQRRPLVSQRVNAGRRWCGEYCFANRGEQIIGGYTNRRGPGPVSNVLRKSVRFFIINIFLIKKTFQVEIWKMDWTNTLSEENWTGQYPIWMTQKLRKGDLRELKNFLGEHAPGPPWTLRRLFRKSVSICPRSAPAKNDYNLEYPWNLV